MIISGNLMIDFRKQNSILVETNSEFMSLYSTYSEEEASKILWSAYYIAVPSDSKNPYRNARNNEERKELVRSQYFPKYIDDYEYIENIFKNIILDKSHALYNIHLTKFEEFTVFIESLDLTTDDGYKKYLDGMVKLEKVYKFYESLRSKFEDEQKKRVDVKEGGGSFSVAEKRRLKDGY